MGQAVPQIVGLAATVAATVFLGPVFGEAFGKIAGAIVTGLVGGVVATGASMLTASVVGLNRRPARPDLTAAAQDRKQIVRQSIAPRQIVYGTARVGGAMAYAFSFGPDNRFLGMVSVLAGHRIAGVDEIWVDDTAIPTAALDANGLVTTGRFAGKLRVRIHDGSQTAADPVLIADSPDGWSADHKLLGCAYMYLRFEYDADVFPSGVRNIGATIRGKADILDPRSNTTGWTDNWALCVLDYLRSPLGVRALPEEIDLTTFIAAANLSDEAVPLNGGATQPRYRADGVIGMELTRREILGRLLSAGAGTLVYVQGQYRLYGGAFSTPTGNLTSSDLAGPARIGTRPARRDVFNAVKGTFIDPTRYWQASEFPAVTAAALEAQDGGRLWRDLELPFTRDAIGAQRLARIELLRGREALTIEVPVKYAAFRFAVWQMLSVTIPELGIAAKPMRITSFRFTPPQGDDGPVLVLRLREESAAAYAWSAADAGVPVSPPDTTLINPLVIPPPTGLAVTPTTSLQGDGAVVPALAVTWTPAAHAFVTGHEVQWRIAAGPGPWSAAEVPGGTARYLIAPVIVGQGLDVRVRAIAALARSDWTLPVLQSGAPDTTPPAAPGNLAATGLIRGYSVSWTLPADLDLAAVEVWEATGGPDPAGRAFVAETRATGFVRTGLDPAAMRWVWVRARDRSGNTSAFVGPVQVTASMAIASDIQDGILNTAKFAAGIEPVGLVSSVPVAKGGNPNTVFNTTDGKLYRWTGSAYTAAVPAADINGQITTTQIGPNAITSDKIAANAITAGKIAAGAVSATEIAAGAITAQKLASETLITQAAQLGTAVVGAAQIADAAITSAKIGNATITTAKIAEAQIDTLRVAGNAVTVFASNSWTGSWQGGWVDVASVVIGDNFFSSFLIAAQAGGFGGDNLGEEGSFRPGALRFRIKRNGEVLAEFLSQNTVPNNSNLFHSAVVFDQPGSGARTYTVAVDAVQGASVTVNRASIVVQQAKR